MATSFENFVNTELPKRIATNESPTTPQAGDIPVFSGVGLLTESKTASEAGLATETFATNAANTAETNAKSYADGLITSIYKFQTTYDPQTTGNFPTTANTVGGVAIKKGFTWVVSGVTGQYTFRGVTVDNGDTLLALVDNASATSAADWHITEKNLGYTPENQANKVNDLTDSTSTAKYTSVKAVVGGLSGKQAALADVITAGTYGSSTQWPVITFNAKGIATGVTLQTVPTPTFTDANFSVQKNGSPAIAASWSLTALTESRVHTYPNKAINFGNLSFIATTNSNNLSGTNCHILGGSNNTVSGTDNIAIGCSDNTNISGSGRAVVILARRLSATYLTPHSLVLGTSAYDIDAFGAKAFAAAVKVQTALCTRVVIASGSVYSITSDGESPTSANCLPALLLNNTFMSARHEFDFIITFGEDYLTIPSRTCFAKRTVYVVRRVTAEVYPDYTPVWDMSIATPQPDVTLGLGSSTVTINFTLDSATNRLIPTVVATSDPSFLGMQVSCRVDSHYNRK